MIKYLDPAERADKLASVIDIEEQSMDKRAGYTPVYATADKDLEWETAEKTFLGAFSAA